MLNFYSKSFLKTAISTVGLCVLGYTHSYAQLMTGIVPAKLEVGISLASDDNEEYVADGTTDFGSSDLEMVTEGSGQQLIGLRFANVNLPKNAVIKNAYIQFTADETHSNTVNLNFYGIAVDSLSTFQNVANNVSKHPITTAKVDWQNVPAWTTGESGASQKTPDLTSIINEIISMNNWKQGNPIGIVVKGENTGGRRVADAFEDASAGKGTVAKLIIEYYVPMTAKFPILLASDDNEEYVADGTTDFGSSDLEMVTEGGGQQLIGLRFANVNLPKGTEIQKAYIQFTADETHSNTVNLNFYGIAVDSLGTFQNVANNVSKHPITTATVDWQNVPAWTAGESGASQKTPDLTNIINEVMGLTNWKQGNPIGIVVKGENTGGRRVADAFEDASAGKGTVAMLEIQYLGVPSQEKPKAKIGEFPMFVGQGEWEYNVEGKTLDDSWKVRMASDSAWMFGNAPLGFGVNTVKTTLPTEKSTYYLRHSFMAKDLQGVDSLEFMLQATDGAVVYLNGKEIYRFNVANGMLDYTSLATQQNPVDAKWNRFTVANSLIENDMNTIAIELHQADVKDAQLIVGLGIRAKQKPQNAEMLPINKNAQWAYSDKGMTPANWKDVSLNDNTWSFSTGTFGYGDAHNTVIFNGENPQNQYPAYYFRKKFLVNDIAKLADTLLLNLRRDDGAIVYLNGKELFRTNMPTGTVDAMTYASSSVGGNDELTYFPFEILKKDILDVLVQGTNVLAVEVHQSDATSSDVSFDLELKEKPKTIVFTCEDGHIGCFTSVLPSSKNQLFNIPSSHVFQAILTSGMEYTEKGNFKGDTLVSTNFDFTGFVPENMTSSTKGHLSVNHETTFGAVSMLDIHFDDAAKLWTIDASKSVDFSEVAGTTRNCSGAVTPWGTILTAEETRNTGDANKDGYEDFGWLVEIDPKTRSVVTYGTGKAQKVWAAGRGSHENAVITNDGSTLYWGEDNGSGNVFKYVLDKKADLSSGKLYALKLNSGLSNNEPTSSVGTWVLIPNTTQADRNNTYSLASSLGATPFNGVEDVEISPLDGKIYFTAKGNNRTYRFSDNGSSVTNFETFVGGKSYTVMTQNGAITEAWATGNDNLTFDDKGNLWVLQDGSQDHIWVVRPNHTQDNPNVELFATTPEGCEPTGMTFSPDFRFAFISLQNPSPTNTASMTDAAKQTIVFNKSYTLVMARKENLGNPVVNQLDNSLIQSNDVMIYPNPSQGNTTVSFTTTQTSQIIVNVYTVDGKLVKAITNTTFEQGNHSLQINDLTSGLYLVEISIDAKTTFLKYLVK